MPSVVVLAVYIVQEHDCIFLLPDRNVQASFLVFSPIKASKRDIYTHFLVHIYFVQWLVKENADFFSSSEVSSQCVWETTEIEIQCSC